MENIKNKQTLGIIGLVVLVAIVGWFIYNDTSSENTISVEEDSEKNIIVNIGEDGSIDAEGYDVEIIEPEDNTVSIPAPSLNSPIVFYVELADDVKSIMTTKIENTRKDLQAKVNYFNGWIELGLQYKIIGDYDGARDSWEYASAIRQSSGLPHRNLGDLYGYYLKDSTKAEENFLKAIELSPDQIEYYFTTASFYKDVLKDTNKAIAIVERGLKANPNSPDLKSLLNSL